MGILADTLGVTGVNVAGTALKGTLKSYVGIVGPVPSPTSTTERTYTTTVIPTSKFYIELGSSGVGTGDSIDIITNSSQSTFAKSDILLSAPGGHIVFV